MKSKNKNFNFKILTVPMVNFNTVPNLFAEDGGQNDLTTIPSKKKKKQQPFLTLLPS